MNYINVCFKKYTKTIKNKGMVYINILVIIKLINLKICDVKPIFKYIRRIYLGNICLFLYLHGCVYEYTEYI